VGPTSFRFHVEAHHLLLVLVRRGLAATHPVAPPYKYKRGGANEEHTHHHTSPLLFTWSLRVFILDALGSLGVEEIKEESGEVRGLSALFSAYTSMDAYSVVSV